MSANELSPAGGGAADAADARTPLLALAAKRPRVPADHRSSKPKEQVTARELFDASVAHRGAKQVAAEVLEAVSVTGLDRMNGLFHHRES